MPLFVQKKQCASCIYRKDATHDLKKLEEEIKDPFMEGFFVSYRVCHHSNSAVCSGFWSRYRNSFSVGQIAQRLNQVVYVAHDTAKIPLDKKAKA